jgi:hypothetical protein
MQDIQETHVAYARQMNMRYWKQKMAANRIAAKDVTTALVEAQKTTDQEKVQDVLDEIEQETKENSHMEHFRGSMTFYRSVFCFLDRLRNRTYVGQISGGHGTWYPDFPSNRQGTCGFFVIETTSICCLCISIDGYSCVYLVFSLRKTIKKRSDP